MSTIQEDLRSFMSGSTAITAVVSSRIHYNYAPGYSAKPHIWYRVNSDREELTMDGVGGLHEASVDVECVGNTAGDCQNVADVVKNRLHGYKGTLGTASCKGAFMDDKDDDYLPYSNQADEGAHVAAFTLKLWFTT